jgi:hypothetical protein
MPEPSAAAPGAPQKRGPGLAVIVILLYAAAFGAALWFLR